MSKGYSHEAFLYVALDDLNSSKILWEAGYFPQSAYMFQQSVEKSGKYLSLVEGILGDGELKKKIKHNPEALFEIMFSKYTDAPEDAHKVFTLRKKTIVSLKSIDRRTELILSMRNIDLLEITLMQGAMGLEEY